MVLCAFVLLFAGCSTRISAERTSSRAAYRQIAVSALESDRVSDAARRVLHRFDLEERFEDDPEGTLKLLHEKACAEDRRDLLYALAELHYLHAERLRNSVKPGAWTRAPDSFLASAIYAWFYLLGDGAEPLPGPFARRFRLACDLYNRAVARGFATGHSVHSVCRLDSGARETGPGRVEISFSQPAFKWNLDDVESFLPADEFAVHGLSVRDRQSGLGAPLIAVSRPLGSQQLTQRIPATLLLRVPGDVRAWSRGEVKASLELYSAYEADHVQVGAQTVPLECDMTAPLAHRLNDSQVWQLGRAQFFSAEERVKSRIYTTQLYEPGRAPVVFVHGTFSSPVYWAEMWNTLRADPVLRERCQFWHFIYNSGNPIVYSAANLRDAIEEQICTLDPEGRDSALRQMVVIGHSQGGLLARLMVTDAGDKIWRAISDRNFDTLPVSEDERAQLQRCLFFKPVPAVKRVVFIATPHQGSYRNTLFVQRFQHRFMTLPGDVVRGTGTLLHLHGQSLLPNKVQQSSPTSLNGMSTSSPVLLALAPLPIAPGVRSHSIVAVKGNGPPEEGADGVVKYSSGHVDYADSELIVRAGHSCQDTAPVIEEVRRILLEHLASAATKSAADK
jgi:pimeloyl-ACP methyl ester carboxylesterase